MIYQTSQIPKVQPHGTFFTVADTIADLDAFAHQVPGIKLDPVPVK